MILGFATRFGFRGPSIFTRQADQKNDLRFRAATWRFSLRAILIAELRS
jgi:hypothetical protein